MNDLIEFKGVSKNYGSKQVLKDISFTLKKGEITGLLGVNGAGKSTTMNILTGCLAANKGEVIIDGINIENEPLKAKQKIGYLPEMPPLYMEMTVYSYLKFVFNLKKCKLNLKDHLKEIIDSTGLTDSADRVIKNLSKGYRQRVGLAQALINNPEMLVLDEPSVGLDPKQIIEIRKLIKNIGKNRTVVLSSHILSEIQAVCNNVIILNNGNIVADEPVQSLVKRINTNNEIRLTVDEKKEKIEKALNSIDIIKSFKYIGISSEAGVEYSIVLDDNNDEDENECKNKQIKNRSKLFFALAEAKIPIIELSKPNVDLEAAFLKLVASSGGAL